MVYHTHLLTVLNEIGKKKRERERERKASLFKLFCENDAVCLRRKKKALASIYFTVYA